jgi:hypothetical protein
MSSSMPPVLRKYPTLHRSSKGKSSARDFIDVAIFSLCPSIPFRHCRYILRYDKNCNKKKFNKKIVHYFNDEARNLHEVYVKPNDDNTQLIWRYKLHDELVPESDKDDPHMYMWALDEKLYIVDDKRWNNKKYGEPKHTGIVLLYRVVGYTSTKGGGHGVSILAVGIITGRTFMQ